MKLSSGNFLGGQRLAGADWLGDVRVEHVQLGRTDLIVERRPNRLLHEGEFPIWCHVEFELEPIIAVIFLDRLALNDAHTISVHPVIPRTSKVDPAKLS